MGIAVDWQEDKDKGGDNKGRWIKKAMKLAEEFTDDFEADDEKKAKRKQMLAQAEALTGQVYGLSDSESEEDDDSPPIRPTKQNGAPSKPKPPPGKPSYLVAKPKPEGEEGDDKKEEEESDDEPIRPTKRKDKPKPPPAGKPSY